MSTNLTKEEIRQARLKSLGVDSSAKPSTSETSKAESQPEMEGAIVRSEEKESSTASSNVSSAKVDSISENEFQTILRIMYRNNDFVTNQDMARWSTEGFRFCDYPTFGLKQGNGGPCGVLAVVQAEILRELLFNSHPTITPKYLRLPNVSREEAEEALMTAIYVILHRIAGDRPVILVILQDLLYQHVEFPQWQHTHLQVIKVHSREEFYLAVRSYGLGEQLSSFAGCLLLLLSAMLTRTLPELLSDFDDQSSSTLIGQFGHCNQELLNLLLAGRATGTVIDGDQSLDGLVVRGLATQTDIGYLSVHEALRYVQVGRYLKVPKYPLWVVAGETHFTVFFTLQRELNDEPRPERILAALRQAFKAVDKDGAGFILVDQLQAVLEQILTFCNDDMQAQQNISVILHDFFLMNRLKSYLQRQVDGGGELLLWETIWVTVSRLMAGDAFDQVVQDNNTTNNKTNNSNHNSQSGRMRSDSEIARELQAEFDGGGSGENSSFLFEQVTSPQRPSSVPFANTNNNNNQGWTTVGSHNNNNNHSNSSNKRPRSDSEIARELQEQWDNEEFGTAMSVVTTSAQRAPSPVTMAAPASADRPVLHRADRYYCSLINFSLL